MEWVFAIILVLLLGAVVVVASGRGGAMSEVYDDRRDVVVPTRGRLTAREVRGVRFTTALRGYRMSEVDQLLDRLAAELDEARAGSAHDAAPVLDADARPARVDETGEPDEPDTRGGDEQPPVR